MGKKARTATILLCGGIAWVLYAMPVLMPWSLDTVFVTGPLIYVGYCLQGQTRAIEAYCVQDLAKRQGRVIAIMVCSFYLALCYLDPGINLSVRQFGRSGLTGIVLYVGIGLLGTYIYLCIFSAMDKGKLLRRWMLWLAALGNRTITLLGTHYMVFYLMDTVLFPALGESNKYLVGLLKLSVALIAGILLNAVFHASEKRFRLFHYL